MPMPTSQKPAIQRPLEFIFLSALCLLLLDWLKISLQQLKRRKKTHFHSSGRKRRCQMYPASPVSCLCQRKNAWTSMTNYKPLKKKRKTTNFSFGQLQLTKNLALSSRSLSLYSTSSTGATASLTLRASQMTWLDSPGCLHPHELWEVCI